MDDSCAVCADALEWVAYGPCGHREVCSTCVVRLRFVLDDRRCCICKTENPAVFVTKAMGDYTRVITDFSVFPADAREGKVGGYWYHEDSQAWFDDPDHYRMVKAMCRLSCSVCAEDEGLDGRRRTKYRNIDQLKGHLFHQHKLFMCTLCLEGRKVFICEQKLYTRSQLDQHIHTGNSEVDGNESERGGFMGHPMCEFCKNPFYGDNELYMHMSTEHYTCHICQRQHPGQYDYYRNYDDLEMHFRQEHFLCEDESCLSKKFVVFQTDVEMKRHNTIEHGGQMSRSKRNAALQIPTSFRYRRNNEEEQRRGRGRGFRRDQTSNQLSMAIQASLEDNARGRASSSGARAVTDHRNVTEDDSTTGSFETAFIDSGAEQPRSAILEEASFPPLSDRELPEPSARYAQALQIARNANRLGEESFPPLPGGEKSNKPKPSLGSESLGKSTLASRLHPKNKGAAMAARSSAWSRPSGNHEMDSSSSASSQTRASKNHKMSTSVSSQPPAATNNVISSSTAVSSQPWPTLSQEASPSSAATQVKPTKENVLAPPVSAHSVRNANAATRLRQSLSDPNLTEGSLSQSTPTMASAVAGNRQLFKSSQPCVEDVQTANKSLIERIRAGVGMDEDRFSAFKNVSAEYRQGQINTWEYLSYVEQFGLSHLILELARLCPDPRKQKELIDAYNANLQVKDPEENGDSDGTISRESKKKGKRGKGKGKAVEHTDNSSANANGAQAESFLDTVRKLQLNMKPQEEDVESLSKDGYRAAKGKVQLSAGEASAKSTSISRNMQGPSVNMPPLANGATTTTTASSGGMSKPQKKNSKFQRVRLGDGSLLELGRSNPSPERVETTESSTGEGLPVRGVWRNGGGTKLVANSLKNP